MTEICIKLISLSDLPRDEKINLRAEIKKVAWNYQEDVDEGKKIAFENYLEALRVILLSY